MQDMTAEFCNKVPVGSSGTLRDTRDNKVYWVSKMADKKCWMTQNLAYDGGGTRVDDITKWKKDVTEAQYHNPGKWIYTNPTNQSSCVNQGAITSISKCVDYGWKNVANMTPSNDPTFTATIDYMSGDRYVYNAHYLIGNYYSWPAATNRSGLTIKEYPAEAKDSVCPEGWRLPSGAADNNEFDILFNAYGVKSGVYAGDYDARSHPFYFLYGGDILPNFAWLGNYGFYQTSTAKSDTNNTALLIATARAVGAYDRFAGFSIRCVAKTLDATTE